MADNDRLPGPGLTNYEWQLEAACRGLDSDLFFHPQGEDRRARNARTSAAKGICRRCRVLEQCRTHALTVREPYGVWGGLSEPERAELLGLQSLRYPAPAGGRRSRAGQARPTTRPTSNRKGSNDQGIRPICRRTGKRRC